MMNTIPPSPASAGQAIALYNRASAEFERKVAHSLALLRGLIAQNLRLTQASSLGAEDVVVTELIHQAGLPASVFVLDTGHLHPQTLALMETIEQRYHLRIDRHQPEPQAVLHFVQRHGDRAMYQSLELRQACCALRKMAPLQKALAPFDGWITGVRREQSHARAHLPESVQEGARLKVNPLADWSWGDVWHFIAQHQLPYNPLHDQFFPSIGCAPCTRAISLGEDFRAGRWWWEQESAKECGLHSARTPS